MKNVLPPVIENLLECAKKSQTAHYSGSFDGKVFDECATAIQAVELYKKQDDDLISLMIRSSGDKSVGINKEEIEIRMWRGYIRPDDLLRKEVKELFANAAEALFETSLGDVRFEDECPDCGAVLNSEKKCPNKNCISNMSCAHGELTSLPNQIIQYCDE